MKTFKLQWVLGGLIPFAVILFFGLLIYILISIVDKDFPRWSLAEGLDAAWQSLGSPGSLTG